MRDIEVAERAENATGSRGRPFPPGNRGRPKGVKNKITREARELFSPVVADAIAIVKQHLSSHRKTAPDCATCRHYLDLVFGYVFGKPTQRQEVHIDDVRASARRIARQLGIDEDEAIREAEAIVRGER